MRIKRTRARLLSALLALMMVLTLSPAAAADSSAPNGCPANNNGAHRVPAGEWETVVEADCATEGILKGRCKDCGELVSVVTNKDPKKHAADCKDNGDGTHSGVCTHHTPNVTIDREPHYFINGVCKQCGAMDYEDVVLNIGSKTRTVNVAVGDVNAKLSAGDVKVLLGKTNVTDSYNLTYLWYYQGNQGSSAAGSGKECPLPATVYDEEGIYYYTLVVSAVPKGNASRQPATETATIIVQVKDLITASAIVSSSDTSLRLGDMDAWSADSVSGQIYDAVQDLCARGAAPTHVRFTGDLSATEVGQLKASPNTNYTFEGKKTDRNLLDDVQFVTGTAAGNYTVDFTAYDSNSKAYAGILTITVQQDVGDLDVLYITARNTPVTLSPDEFEAYWNKVCPGGVLDSISFDETPKSVEGTLYIDYVSPSLPGDRVRTSDAFYVDPGRYEYGIDSVTFVPGAKQSEYVPLRFTACGTRSGSRINTRRSGTMYIFLSADGRSADVTVNAAADGAAFPADNFQKAYQAATGGTGSSFYIQLLDVPESGTLYVGRTANRNGTRLTQTNIQGRPFSYSDSRGETISSLTYVPGTAASESIRYVASSIQGKPLYAGIITFTTSSAPAAAGMTVSYAASSAGVTFRSADFETLPGAAAPKLSMVSFTPPSAAAGTLYYGRTATTTGIALTSDSIWLSVSSPAIAGAYSMDNVTFVPAAGYTGTVTIPFSSINAATVRSTGEVRITVTATTPAPNPGPNPGTGTPAAAGMTVTYDSTSAGVTFRSADFETLPGAAAPKLSMVSFTPPSAAAGTLYYGRTATTTGIALTSDSIWLSVSSPAIAGVYSMDNVTFVPAAGYTGTVTIPFSSINTATVRSTGEVRITVTAATPAPNPDPNPGTGTPAAAEMTVTYDSTSNGVTFRSADFETLPGAAAPKLSMVSFTPPSEAAGTLYYGRTATTAGIALTSSSSWFSVSSPAIAGAYNMDNVTFVPAAGYSGPVTIPFTSINTEGGRPSGEIRITVTATTPTPNPDPNPGTSTPTITFSDVPQSEWYYRYVTDLATSGVLGGYEDGTFRPKETVKMGQALKMIMTAVGYPEQAATGSHWASGYLDRAKADGLWPANTNEDLDRRVSRYTIAEIAVKAMKLPTSTVTASPFSDMAVTEAAGPYVMALYNIGVITGEMDDATNTLVYRGSVSIWRKDFAAIIWRVRNYVSTGNVNGVTEDVG